MAKEKWSPSRKEIEGILDIENKREIFLVGHVIIERMLEKILEEKFDIPLQVSDEAIFMWSQKMLILEKSGKVQGRLLSNLRAINRIRRGYAHYLNPDEGVIQDRIKSLGYLGHVPKHGLGGLEKYRACVIATFDELVKLL